MSPSQLVTPKPTGSASQSGQPTDLPTGSGAGEPSKGPSGAATPRATGGQGGVLGVVRLAAAVLPDGTRPGMPAADAPSGRPSPSSSTVTGDPATAAWVEVERRTSSILFVVALLAGIIAVAIGFILAEAMIRPLRRLGGAASAVASGDLARRSGVGDRKDEIGELGRSFDAMAEALERSDESRRRFLQDAVHELGTPITAIHTTASAILDGLYEPEPRHLETIRDEARLLGRIVDDLRTIALAEMHRLPVGDTPVDIASIADFTADAFSAVAAAGGCRVVAEASGPAWVAGDPDRLRQVLGALVDNALRHSPEGGTVRIVTSCAEATVEVAVEDEGAGLGPDADRVFDRYFRGDPSDPDGRHAGLGLAIVRALVEAHGGVVTAAGGDSGGAVFRVRLPGLPAPAQGSGHVADDQGRPSVAE